MKIMSPVCVFLNLVSTFFSSLVKSLSHSWVKLRWSPSSQKWLVKLDQRLRSSISHKNQGKWVSVEHNGKIHDIWTVTVEGENNDAIPIVAIHGMGGGSNMFINNIDSFARHRDVYLLDLPGFGLSSRPELDVKYSDDGKSFKMDENDVEQFYTETLEKWFIAMDLHSVILIGHSFGSYISAVYSMAYPDRIQHLILADPWGFPPRPKKPVYPSFKIRVLVFILSKFYYKVNVFTPIRALGPLGPTVFWYFRSDLHKRYAITSKEDTTFFDYLYACNTVASPSGENGFVKLSIPFGFARKPILERVDEWSPDLDVTFIYGEKSWVNSHSGYEAKNRRSKGHVDVQIVKGAGHHVHTDRPTVFNHIVTLVTQAVDRGERANITEEDLQRGQVLSGLHSKPLHPSQPLICNDEAGIRVKSLHDNIGEDGGEEEMDEGGLAGGDNANKLTHRFKNKSKVAFTLGENCE